MPSDDRLAGALRALAEPVHAFRAALAQTADEMAQWLRQVATGREAAHARWASELGPFAEGRIAVDRLAQILGPSPSLDGAGAEVVRRAHATLIELLGRGEAAFTVSVSRGESLYDAVAQRLADLGRAFGAARVAREVREGRLPEGRHLAVLERFPFVQWNRAERRLAPPLVVEVEGADLRAAGLADLLDGKVKLVLVVGGECAPAPLARLIAPGTFVQQALSPEELGELATWDGPGVAALVHQTAARFVHDPRSGRTPAERLRIAYVPAEPPRRALDGISAAQQAEELALLHALAQPASPAPPATAATASAAPEAPAADPVAQLAAWLLAQAELEREPGG
jgi:hypothetical protein